MEARAGFTAAGDGHSLAPCRIQVVLEMALAASRAQAGRRCVSREMRDLYRVGSVSVSRLDAPFAETSAWFLLPDSFALVATSVSEDRLLGAQDGRSAVEDGRLSQPTEFEATFESHAREIWRSLSIV